MRIELITYGDDATWKRKTIMRDGRMCGLVDDRPGAPVLMTVPADDEEQEAIRAEVERIKGTPVPQIVAPAMIPAELQADDELADETLD